MNKTSLLLTSSLLLAYSHSATADMDIRGERTSFFERNKPTPIGFNYTYIDLLYAYTSLESNTDDNHTAHTFGSEISFSVTPNVSANLTMIGGAESGGDDVLQTAEIYIGATYNHPLSDKADLYGSFKMISIQFESDDSDDSISNSGYSIDFGFRQRINDDMEWGASLINLDIDGETATKAKLNLSFGSDRETQYIGGIESTNTDLKKSALTFVIRFNY